ncbi:bacteriocin [Bradyrhizobium sp. AUGA SZCCT0182]|uniref:bacteriocin n=1 Tax=Bradyrhizobium sp. AUGA SZCCT0182 TaxID=2807667 RepID=UPI001BA6DED3|nr:bacteriocin [Bradyrhizobium sp. AUGA SZCCT0182]MBR1233400.1 bacteriocin [Bradyrhizobium sp. AUGA SZCCT0182]
MNNQIRDLGPTKPSNERAKRSLIDVEMELSEEELSNVSGGSLHLTCAKGQHFATGRITC